MNPHTIEPENEICRLSASALAGLIRCGELSAEEVTAAYLDRIQTVNQDLNALVIPLFAEAQAAAAKADRKRSRGEPLGPLHGVPTTIKEQYMVAGTDTTLGVQQQVGRTYTQEGPLVQGLRRAGAIILGKTNILQTLVGWESDNRVYGRTNHPWNLDRTPGGSSGGEAALIAAGGSALGLAGDLGGSIRIPAHFCGVHGLKPTSGRLTNTDFPPGLLSGGQEGIIAQPGPIARRVADLNLAMAALAETSMNGTADFVPPVPWPNPSDVQIEGLRVGIYTSSPYFGVSPSVCRVVEQAGEALAARGVVVKPFAPPNMEEGVRLFLGILSAAQGIDYKQLLGEEKPIPQVAGTLRGIYTPNFMLPWLGKIMAARGQDHLAYMLKCLGGRSAAEYWALIEARNAFRAGFARRMEKAQIDIVVCPPFALPAPLHGATADLFPAGCYAIVYNLLGNPAGVISLSRVGPEEESDRPKSMDQAEITARQVETGSAGLPVGVQVVGKHWREDVVLAVMTVLEEAFQARPSYPLRAYHTAAPAYARQDLAALS